MCFTTQIAQFYHTGETIWMVTYLSPSYTPICTRIHTYIPVVLEIAHHHIHIYICIHICSVSPHRVKYLYYRTDSPTTCIHIYIHIYSVSPHRVNICFTSQMAQFYHSGETNNLDGDLFITTLYTHMYTHTHKYTSCFTDNPPSYTHIYIYIYIHIYYVSPHRVKYLYYRTDSPPSCI